MARTRASNRTPVAKLEAPFSVKVTKKTVRRKEIKEITSDSEELIKVDVLQKSVELTPLSTPKTTIKRSPKKSPTKKIDYEDSVAHVEIPSDLLLPAEFEKYHTSDFISGVKHILQIDPSLYPAVTYKNFDQFKLVQQSKRESSDLIRSYWYSLISSVISQQISGAAAKSIEEKFKNLFEGEEINATNTLKKTHEELRSAGLSNQKVKYVQHISETFGNPASKLVDIEFYKLPIDEIIEELVTLKGIGEWSAKMFAIFTLKQMNVFAYDDLGIARGMSKYLSRRPVILKTIKEKVNDTEELKALLKRKSKFEKKDSRRDWVPYHDQYVIGAGERFSPYQSVLMLIMWRLSSTNLEVLENTGVPRE